MLQDQHAQDNGSRRAGAPAAPAQRVPPAERGIDLIDELVTSSTMSIVRNSSSHNFSDGQQHLEDAPLPMRATNHGASSQIERVQCDVGSRDCITAHDDVTRERASSN